MKKTVVVGGGVVGIVAAILEARKGHKVVLIEKDPTIGGLLRSFKINGIWYDYGAHLPAEFKIEDLDNILYGDTDRKAHFEELSFLRSENFFNGKWNLNSPLPDIHSFDAAKVDNIRSQLLETQFDTDELNLGQYLTKNFGPIVKEEVFDNILQKLQGTSSDNLHKEVLRIFGVQRVIAFPSDETKELKKIPKYDNIIGFHSYEDGTPSSKYFYPKLKKGIGAWIELLEIKMKALGVEILTSQNIKELSIENGHVKKIVLDEKTLELDFLVWTVPINILESLLKVNPLSAGKLEFRTTTLVNMSFEKPFKKTKPQLVVCWDPSYYTFRATLYPNIFKDGDYGAHNLTVEVLGDMSYKDKQELILRAVTDEMYKLGIVDEDNKILDVNSMYLGPTFPVMTPAFIEMAKAKNVSITNSLKNAILLGRGSGKSFFMSDTINECYRELNEK